jgi:hypothetical protein
MLVIAISAAYLDTPIYHFPCQIAFFQQYFTCVTLLAEIAKIFGLCRKDEYGLCWPQRFY